jgi:hypothetical protein
MKTALGKLLARALPRVIKSEKENQRMIAELEDLRGGPPRLVGWWFPVSSSRGVVY